MLNLDLLLVHSYAHAVESIDKKEKKKKNKRTPTNDLFLFFFSVSLNSLLKGLGMLSIYTNICQYVPIGITLYI